MPTINFPTPLIVGQHILIPVVDFDQDNNVDTTELCSVTPSVGAFPEPVPGNNRKFKVTGSAPGAQSVVITAPGVPATGDKALTVNFQVNAAPVNQSRVELATAGIEGPF